MRRHPELNARIEGDEIVMGPSVHLGFAAQTDRGLMVPVVRDAQVHTLEQLAVAVTERTGVPMLLWKLLAMHFSNGAERRQMFAAV